MSFILEALRKSEAERRAAPTARGAAAGVYVVAQARRSLLRTLVVPATALAVGIGVAVGWNVLSRGDAPAAVPNTSSQPLIHDAGGDRVAAVPTTPTPVVPGSVSAPVKSGRDAAVGGTSVVGVPSAARSVVPAMPAAVAVVRPPVKTVVAAVAPPAAVIRPAAPVAVAAIVPITEPIAAPTAAAATLPVAAPRTVAAAVPAAAPAPTVIPATAPAAVAASAAAQATSSAVSAVAATSTASTAAEEPPKLSISGFANSDDTRARFAVIDNRIVREGEAFAPDLRLVQVGDDGVVVEYKGRRYRP